MEQQLYEILQAYCADFNEKRKNYPDMIVDNSIPIVWFGDLEKYQASPVKIVTVGLNPSWHEFWEKSGVPLTIKRFREIDLSKPNENNLEELRLTLNEYFQANPFRQYFGGNEFVLHYVGGSYGGKMFGAETNITAVHVDVFSALATVQFFTKCPICFDTKLFQKLFDYLSPDVVLASIGKNYGEAWQAIGGKYFWLNPKNDIFGGKYKNKLEAYRSEGRLIVYGKNNQAPFKINKEIFEKTADILLEELVKTVTER